MSALQEELQAIAADLAFRVHESDPAELRMTMISARRNLQRVVDRMTQAKRAFDALSQVMKEANFEEQ